MVYTNHNDIDAWLRPAVLFATCNYLVKLFAYTALFTRTTAAVHGTW
jgi:hypothetical protein